MASFHQVLLEARKQQLMEAIDPSVEMRASDRIAVEEVCRLCALLTAIDEDLETRGVSRRNGEARSLIALRVRASGQLRQWCIQLGATNASRNGIRPSDLIATALARASTVSTKEAVQAYKDLIDLALEFVPGELEQRYFQRIQQYIEKR
jgi:hypothetical protein